MEHKDISLEKIIFEARYNQSFGFLDKSKEIVTNIDKEMKELFVYENLAKPFGFRMKCKRDNIIFNFTAASFNLSQQYIKDLDYQFFITYLKTVSSIISLLMVFFGALFFITFSMINEVVISWVTKLHSNT